ncbi:MAG: HAMP domain-containing protein, partial [Anaerolineae bacterium]|nr:HAMP domain-containing protein [Anaerolineae bacterium]
MTAELRWKEIWSPVAGLIGAFLIVLVIAIFIMQAPASDLKALTQFLLTSSIPSLLVGYLIFTLGRKWLRSIRYKVLLAYGLGIVIAILNIFVTSQLMFVSQHDFFLLGLLLIFAGILSASFGYLLAANITQSLNLLREGTHELANGDFSARVRLTELDELSDVADAFNKMADDLQLSFARQKELEQARRELIAAVSHD